MGNLSKAVTLAVAFVFLISLLISVPTNVKAQAPRVLKTFSGTTNSYFLNGGMYAYTINVTMSIETESNGEWVVNNSYPITWQISIVNYSPDALKQPNNLSLTFHDPFLRIPGNLNSIISQTSVNLSQDGFLKVEFTPGKSAIQADIQTTLLENENYSSQEQFQNAHWDQNFDIWINIVDSLVTPTPSPTVPEFSWLMILPLFLSILFVVVLIRNRKVSEIITL